MNIPVSQRVQNIRVSPTLAITTRTNELLKMGKDIINLGAGEPDFDTPEHIKVAAITALKDGKTKYTNVDGCAELKDAIINKFKRENDLEYHNDQILVSCGAKHSLYNLLQSVCNAGDEIIIPAPYWTSYPDMAKLSDAIPVIIDTTMEAHFKISPEQLQDAITDKTRLFMFNSPSNPTGVCYSKDELNDIATVLLEHPHVLIVTDDIYEHILWKPEKFTNIVNACAELYDRTIVVNGVSKAYSMTGWRIGYAAGPNTVIKNMKKIQSQSTSNPCSISQVAAIAALNGSQECVRENNRVFKERHDFVLRALQDIDGITCMPSDGTFYSFPDMNGLITQRDGITNDIELTEFFLEKAEVAMVPGSAFGAAGCMRISFATSMENLKTSMDRIKAALK